MILVGRLGADPETRYTQSGTAITNVSIATSESVKNKQTGEREERTEWHRVVFFNRLAEIVAEHQRKGSQIYVEGRIQTKKWQDKNGQDRYTTEIIAAEMKMLGSKTAGQGSGNYAPPPPPPASRSPANAPPSDGAYQPDYEDDIPF